MAYVRLVISKEGYMLDGLPHGATLVYTGFTLGVCTMILGLLRVVPPEFFESKSDIDSKRHLQLLDLISASRELRSHILNIASGRFDAISDRSTRLKSGVLVDFDITPNERVVHLRF